MKKPAMLLTALLVLTACADNSQEPPEETDIIFDTELITSSETSPETEPAISETTVSESAETSVMTVPTEAVTLIETTLTESESAETEISTAALTTLSETQAPEPAKQSFRIKMTGEARGELLEDTFFGKKGETVDVELPKGTRYTKNGEMAITLTENARIAETSPCRIPVSEIAGAEPVLKNSFTLTVTDRTKSHIVGKLNEYTEFADKGESVLINVSGGTEIEVSNIIEIKLDNTAEITDTPLRTSDSERETTAGIQISGSYTLRLVTPEETLPPAVPDEPRETTQVQSETVSLAEETSVTERYADISFKVHMTGFLEGELLEDTFFGQAGDRFVIRLGDSYTAIIPPGTDAVMTLWNDAYIGITDSLVISDPYIGTTDSLVIDGSVIYSLTSAE